MTGIEPFFSPRSIAIIGASHSPEKLGGVVLRNLLDFRGRIYPVHPAAVSLAGLRAVRTVRELPGPVDLALVIRPAGEVPSILRDLSGITQHAVIMSAGFSEVGEDALQQQVTRTALSHNMRIMGPNCMGICNPRMRLDTFFLSRTRLPRPSKGNVAVVSQSGAVLSCLMTEMRSTGVGASKIVGYGNAADVSEADIYDYLAEDPDTEVVASYIESVPDGRRFADSARALASKKRLILLKAGKEQSGRSAAVSHTGRLAGSYEVFRSVLKRRGIREASDLECFLDSMSALSRQKPQEGKRVCIITNGGGSGVLAADECTRLGLEIPELPDSRRRRLMKAFPGFYVVGNPIDLTAQVKDEDYVAAFVELREEFDAFLLIALPNVFGITEALGAKIAKAFADRKKPLVFHLGAGSVSRRIARDLQAAGIPVYPTPERAVRGLKALL